MKLEIKHIVISVMLILVITGCERELESEGIASGIIRYPSITLNEGQSVVLVAGEESYKEAGAVALLGNDDISEKITIEGAEDIDTSTPGVYPVNYSVTIINELEEELTVTESRYVIVASENIADTDLSGNYKGTGFSSSPLTVAVTKLGDGWYSIPDVLSSANGIGVNFAHLGGDVILIPNQTTPFGDVNTTDEGTSAILTENGFIWTVSISCCGLFGPVNFVKQ